MAELSGRERRGREWRWRSGEGGVGKAGRAGSGWIGPRPWRRDCPVSRAALMNSCHFQTPRQPSMASAHTTLNPLADLIDRLRDKTEADSQAIKALQATVASLQKDTQSLKKQVQTLKADKENLPESTSVLQAELTMVQSSTQRHDRQITKLQDSSVSHQAQLDPLVAEHHRKRDRSPAPSADPPPARPKTESVEPSGSRAGGVLQAVSENGEGTGGSPPRLPRAKRKRGVE